MNNSHLAMTSPFEATQAAYAALSGAQTHTPRAQVMGAAVLFLTLCEELRLDPSEVLNKASRVAKDADWHFAVQVRALRTYIKNEIKDR